MNNKNLTELVFILDKSGSMSGMEKDTIGGFNSMIERQKEEEGEAIVSTVLFSNKVRLLHDRKKLDEILPLTKKDYKVDGCTALCDAIGGTIKHIENIYKYARKEDVPNQTLFVITTDGMENASVDFNGEQIKQMIKDKQENFGWKFIFLGANMDAAQTAESIGVPRSYAVNYSVEEDTESVYEELNDTIGHFRSSGEIVCGAQMESRILARRQRLKDKKKKSR